MHSVPGMVRSKLEQMAFCRVHSHLLSYDHRHRHYQQTQSRIIIELRWPAHLERAQMEHSCEVCETEKREIGQ
jgi:hypothetical protein